MKKNFKLLEISIIITAILALVFGCLWAAMIFVGKSVEQIDGFKDMCISFISIFGTLVATKIGKAYGEHKEKKDEENKDS